MWVIFIIGCKSRVGGLAAAGLRSSGIRAGFTNTTLKQEVSQISEGLYIWEIEI